jgi:hypothetical protein
VSIDDAIFMVLTIQVLVLTHDRLSTNREAAKLNEQEETERQAAEQKARDEAAAKLKEQEEAESLAVEQKAINE